MDKVKAASLKLASEKGLSRTWLIAVMHGEEYLAAEFLIGSRNFIPRLLEICRILVTNTTSLDGYGVLISRDNFRNELKDDDIRKFADAWFHATGRVPLRGQLSIGEVE